MTAGIGTVGDPPFNGAVRLEGTEPIARYPRTGRGIDRDQLTSDLVEQLLRDRQPAQARIIEIKPELTRKDVDRAVVVAEALLDGPVVLYREDPYAEVTFEVDDL